MKSRLTLTFLFLATLPAARSAAQQTPAAAAEAAAPATAADAAARLRQLYFQRDFEGAYAGGAALVTRFPAAPGVRAWWIMSAAALQRPEAGAAADSLARAFPGDFWGEFARAYALAGSAAQRDSAYAAAAHAAAIRPVDPDAGWLQAIVRERAGQLEDAIAYADSASAGGRATVELLVVKGRSMAVLARGRQPDSALAQRAAAVLDQALRLDSTSVTAWLWAGVYGTGGGSERYARLRRALQLAPYSLQVHQRYWDAIAALEDRSPEEKTAETVADAEALLGARGDVPRVLVAVSRELERLEVMDRAWAIEDTIVARWPGSAEEEEVLFSRMMGKGFTSDSAGRARRLRFVRDYLARPTHRDGNHLRIAATLFFYDDLTGVPDAEVERNAAALSSQASGDIKVRAALALADRGVGLAVAERLAREAPEQIRAWQLDLRGPDGKPLPDSQTQRFRQSQLGRAQDVLGWVLVAQGRLAEGDSVLSAARGRFPSPLMLYHAGRLEEKRGNLAGAQTWYEKGLALQPVGGISDVDHEPALRRVYLARHGSPKGLRELLASIRAKQPMVRVGGGRGVAFEKPEPLPRFALPVLGGGTVRSDALLGKVVVVDFWGTWCSPCVAEMPEFQKFWAGYRGDPDVRLVTIATNDDRVSLRDFMSRRKYDFPVLLDDGYASRIGVTVFPTTWIIDRQGRKAYYAMHAGEKELGRLVELLKRGGAPATSRADSTAAAARLRALYFQHDYSAGVSEGRELVARFPAAPAVSAWYIGSLAQSGMTDAAVAAANALLRAHPTGPWGHFARALAFLVGPERAYDALAPALRARRGAARDPDAWWLYGAALERVGDRSRAVAVADSALSRFGASAPLLAVKGRALANVAMGREGADTARLAQAAIALDEALRLDSLDATAVEVRAFVHERQGSPARAYALYRRAAQLLPYALDVHEQYWGEIQQLRDRTEEQKRDEIVPDAERLLRARPDDPAVLSWVASAFDDLKLPARRDSLEALLLARFPNSPAAEQVLMGRVYRAGNASVREEGDTARANAERRRLLREFVARPRHVSRERLAQAYRSLFWSIEKDTTVGENELVRVIHGLAAEPTYYNTAFEEAPIVLADRKLALPYAEQLALQAMPATREWLARAGPRYPADLLPRIRKDEIASAHDALGWVYLVEGKRAAAQRELRAALAADPRSVNALFHMGRLEEARGRADAAEKLYTRGYVAERRAREHPNEDALRRLYAARHGSPAGFDAYIATVQEKARAERRDSVLAQRVKAPRAMPAFTLARLGGGTFASDSLAGKVAVVNFWGVWCGPCVIETPQLQKLHEKYRASADVVFVTIDTNEPEATVREFMAKRKFDFPVLLDDGFADHAGIVGFPTTWFVGRDGRITYQAMGGSDSDTLLEDYIWRIEALRAEKPAVKAAPQR